MLTSGALIFQRDQVSAISWNYPYLGTRKTAVQKVFRNRFLGPTISGTLIWKEYNM